MERKISRATAPYGPPTADRSIMNMPRPWVTAISVFPIQKRSSTEQLVGPSLVGDHVAPASSLAYRPISVPRYRKREFRGCTAMARTGAFGSDVPTLLQLRPPSVVFQTLPDV